MRSLHRSLVLEKQRLSQMKRKAQTRTSQCCYKAMASGAADIAPLLEKSFQADSPCTENTLGLTGTPQLIKNQMRWHPRSYYHAASKYQKSAQLSHVAFSTHTHWSEPHSGIQLEFIGNWVITKTKYCTISIRVVLCSTNTRVLW